MPTPQSCVEALLIESGLSLPYAVRYKKPGFLPRTPLPPRMSRTTFYVRWHHILKSVMLIQGGRGVPAQKFGLFVTAGGRTAASFADRLLAHTQQAFGPKNRRTVIRDAQIETTTNPMHYRNFWNVQWAKEHAGEWS